MTKSIKKNWIILVILGCAFFLRFYRLPQWYFFNIDEDWSNFIIRKIVVFHRPVLLGWDIPGGFYVPPIMYYLDALLMLIYNNNPLGFAINASFVGIFAVFLLYKVTQTLFKSKQITLIATIIYCFSYLVNIYNRLTVNLYLVPVLTLLTYLAIYKIIKENNKKWLYLLSLVLIFATQEGSTVSLIILSILSLSMFKCKLPKKKLILPALIFLASFIPLLIFDIRHDFQISRKYLTIINVFVPESRGNLQFLPQFKVMFTAFSRIIFPTGPNDINIQIIPCEKYLEIIKSATPKLFPLIGLAIISFFFLLPEKKKKILFIKQIFLIHLLIISGGLIVYSLLGIGRLYEWFFILLAPTISMMVGYLITFIDNHRYGRLVSFTFLILFLSLNIKYFISGTAAVGYQDKLNAVLYIKSFLKKNNFSFNVIGNGCNKYGYRYLFAYVNCEPVKSYIDYEFAGWLYSLNENTKADYEVTFVPLPDIDSQEEQEQYKRSKQETVSSKKFGSLEVLITKLKD